MENGTFSFPQVIGILTAISIIILDSIIIFRIIRNVDYCIENKTKVCLQVSLLSLGILFGLFLCVGISLWNASNEIRAMYLALVMFFCTIPIWLPVIGVGYYFRLKYAEGIRGVVNKIGNNARKNQIDK
jgi:hypothetical protein